MGGEVQEDPVIKKLKEVRGSFHPVYLLVGPSL